MNCPFFRLLGRASCARGLRNSTAAVELSMISHSGNLQGTGRPGSDSKNTPLVEMQNILTNSYLFVLKREICLYKNMCQKLCTV